MSGAVRGFFSGLVYLPFLSSTYLNTAAQMRGGGRGSEAFPRPGATPVASVLLRSKDDIICGTAHVTEDETGRSSSRQQCRKQSIAGNIYCITFSFI